MASEDTNKPLVSVIMPVKNGEHFLKASITSIFEQDYPFLELIVVDGQSTDRTAQIANAFKDVRYLYQEDNPGIGPAKNLGIAEAKGGFIAFISHDDLWPAHKLSMQMDYMTRHPEIQYTITRVKFFLEPGCQIPWGFKKELLEGDYVGKMPETLVARTSLFDAIGGFNTDLSYMEDIDWFHRADRRRVPMAVIQEVLLHKRIHDTNVSYDTSKIRKTTSEIFSSLRSSVARHRAGRPRGENF